jgi:hypothetical protein
LQQEDLGLINSLSNILPGIPHDISGPEEKNPLLEKENAVYFSLSNCH